MHGTADSSVRHVGGLGDGIAGIEHSIAPCTEGREVQLTTVEGAGHQWPGGTQAIWQLLRGQSAPLTTKGPQRWLGPFR